MSQAAPSDDPSRELLAALAGAWLSADPLAVAASRALEICRRSGGDVRVQALSAAFEALRISLTFPRTVDTLQRVLDNLANARHLGWWRAIALSEAAEANMLSLHGLSLDDAVERLEGHGPADADPRPPAERVWTDKALAVLHGTRGHYAPALDHGVRADALALRTGLALPQIEACQSLAFVFLSVGDFDGAEAVLQRALAVLKRCERSTYSVGYNLLLCHVVAGRHELAVRLLAEHPTLLDGNPGFAAMDCLVARVWQDAGDGDRALEALARMGTTPDDAQAALRANRVWLEASVRIRHGQSATARVALQAHLAEAESQGTVLSPMNRTQLELVLSQACEAEGDLPAALAALKRSRLSCFNWVADSMRSRLQALHLDQPGQDTLRHQRHEHRVRVVEEAVQQARQEQSQEASARQARFLAQVTHEMRNPLHGVIGMTSTACA